jgi:hypothetical protein
MAEPKTKPTSTPPEELLALVEPESKRQDCFELLDLYREVTGEQGTVWGDSGIGFGLYTQTYADGSQRDWAAAGFAPRKQNVAVYMLDGFDRYQDLINKLGKVKTSKVCIYMNKLEDVDLDVLREIIRRSYLYMINEYE